MAVELLIKGGTLVDPAQGIHGRRDVAFAGGLVAAVAPGLPGLDLCGTEAGEIIDATGLIVTPGLVDPHVHVFHDVSHYGIEPDPACLATGATTVVDAGSAGAATFSGFRRFVIEPSRTRILALLNISSQGMLTAEIGELVNPDYADVERACATAEQHRNLILGIKVRLTRDVIASERSGLLPLARARQAANALGLPVMVHPQEAWCETLDEVLAVLRPGDIVTHCFHGRAVGILDAQGHVRPAVREARARGVLFDVGHGAGSFAWEVAERALDQGFVPDTISSDLHVYSLPGPVHDLATTASKFLHLGMALDEVIEKVTAAPVLAFPALAGLGTLAPGAPGDAVVFALEEGRFPLADSHGRVQMGTRKLVPVTVVKGGQCVLPA